MMEQQGGQGGVICGKCGASFETQDEFDQHVRETHPDQEKPRES